jgi:hypothetical protein
VLRSRVLAAKVIERLNLLNTRNSTRPAGAGKSLFDCRYLNQTWIPVG